MAAKVSTWHNDKQTILIRTWTGDLNQKWIAAVMKADMAKVSAVSHTVHVITDFRTATEEPMVTAARRKIGFPFYRLPNIGMVVVVPVDDFSKLAAHSYFTELGIEYLIAATIDEALEAIFERYPDANG